MLGVGSTTIKRWADDNTLSHIRTAGGHRRFKRTDVERLVREQALSSSDVVSADKWVVWLTENADVVFVRDEIEDLRTKLGDWFRVADFLGAVVTRIGQRWATGECSIIEEHMATNRLSLALAAISSAFPVPGNARVCLLATLSGEQHSVGLGLTQLCLRSAGLEALWAGTSVPVGDLVAYIRNNEQQMVGLSASKWSTDYGFLSKACSSIAEVCREREITLILGGEGAWPDSVEYGCRCQSFADLRVTLEALKYV